MRATRFAGYRFRPRLLTTLLTVVIAAILIGLGRWQLDRAEQKQILLEARREASRSAPLDLNEFRGSWGELRFRRAVVRGQYLTGRHVLLDNQIHQGRAGFHVISAFAVENLEPLLLVNRGWVPLGADRSVLPAIPDMASSQALSGTLDAVPQPGLRLAADVVVSEGWPLVVLELAETELTQRLGRPVLPLVLKLDPRPGERFDREWVWVESFGPERHLSYAFQWHALAAALIVIYLVVNFRSPSGDKGKDDGAQDGKTGS